MSDKNAECESLQYRLHHFEEINTMMDPPGHNVLNGGSGVNLPQQTEDGKSSEN